MKHRDREMVKKIVQMSILEEFDSMRILNKDMLLHDIPELKDDGACFVTLKLDNQLRGCIGSLKAYRPLYDDLVSNAKSAAFSDYRFNTLDFLEYQNLTYEISLLSHTQEIKYIDIDDLRTKIRPNVDGVVLTIGNYSATYLPQVWEDLPHFDEFFTSLCQKAGLRPNALTLHPKIEIYQVENF